MPAPPVLAFLGRLLILAGLVLLLTGGALLLVSRYVGGGRLPGDIVWSRGGVTVVIPLATCLLASLLLTLLLWFLLRR